MCINVCMILLCIIQWLLLSIMLNLSGVYIGYRGMIRLIYSVLIWSPIFSWYILYNLLMIDVFNNSLLYSVSYVLISLYNYNLSVCLEFKIYAMIFIILLINMSYIINIYILKYLYKDKNIVRFMSFMMLFTFSMMILIMSSDIISVFIGWEMIGIVSLLLIGYYNNRIESVRSGLKAIMYNRIGDVLLMLNLMCSINLYNGSNLNLYMILISYKYYNSNSSILLLLGISIIMSAWAKSAQLGLQPWLLDAMEGPTPVSALLHSATLITAGIVLLYKFSYILYYNNSLVILLILLTSISCILNSISAINYLDVKRIIAYSTCTHVALMLLIISIDLLINISEISLLHLFYHGWSKSLIFIVCGYLMGLFGTQDLRLFGSIYLQIPLLFVIVNLSLLTIYGFPGSSISSSKDIILEFGLLSVYGCNLLIPFFVILLLSQGYSLGLLLYLLWNSSSINSIHSVSVYYGSKMLYSVLFCFVFVMLIIIYVPYLLYDVLLYTNIHVSHHVISFDVFSLLSVLGFLLSYYNNTNGVVPYSFVISNNRLLFDKIWSSLLSVCSVWVLYSSSVYLEYGFFLYYLNVVNVLLLVFVL